VLPHTTFRALGAHAVLDAMVDRLGLPVMLKPDQGGSALGTQVVGDRAELPAAMVSCLAYSDDRAGGAVRRRRGGRGHGRRGRGRPACAARRRSGGERRRLRLHRPLHAGRAQFHCPARVDAATASALADAALAAHQLLGLRDVSRTDAVVDAAGRVQILEVNVSPGLTDTSLLPTAAAAAGLDLGRLYERSSAAPSRGFT
jgi:D-alanine-D-alanine ligase